MNKEKEASELKKKYFGPEGELFKKREALMGPIQTFLRNKFLKLFDLFIWDSLDLHGESGRVGKISVAEFLRCFRHTSVLCRCHLSVYGDHPCGKFIGSPVILKIPDPSVFFLPLCLQLMLTYFLLLVSLAFRYFPTVSLPCILQC